MVVLCPLFPKRLVSIATQVMTHSLRRAAHLFFIITAVLLALVIGYRHVAIGENFPVSDFDID